MAEVKKIKIDDVEYAIEDLNDAVKASLNNLRIVDQEIARLQTSLGIAKTARAVYANSVKQNLPKSEQ